MSRATPSERRLRSRIRDLRTYWDSPGRAIGALAEILHEYGLCIRYVVSFDDSRESMTHRFELEITETGECIDDAVLVFQWFRLRPGRYEITAYLS